MEFIAVLGVATIAIVVLAALIYRKSGAFAFPLGIALFYYWTLLGPWFIVMDQLGGNSGLRYEYLFYKLFALHLDEDYLWTLILYSSFMISLEVAVLLTLPRRDARKPPQEAVIAVSHTMLIAMGGVTGLLAFLVVRNSLGMAAGTQLSAYAYMRSDTSLGSIYGLSQVLTRLSLFSLTMGLAVWFSDDEPRLVSAQPGTLIPLYYLAALGGVVFLTMMMGQRRELASCAICSGLFYAANARRPSKLLAAGLLSAMLVVLGIAGLARGGGSDGSEEWGLVWAAFRENALSNEPFAAHMSLYGALAAGLPPTYGSSFVYLAHSLIPSGIYERPPDIYEYYVDGVRAVEGQGYNIHHATGWYLNFGPFGLIAGALLLGWLWAFFFRRQVSVSSNRGHLRKVFSVVGFSAITSFFPSICRGGPEVYRAIALEALILPSLMFAAASLRPALWHGRPVLTPVPLRRKEAHA